MKINQLHKHRYGQWGTRITALLCLVCLIASCIACSSSTPLSSETSSFEIENSSVSVEDNSSIASVTTQISSSQTQSSVSQSNMSQNTTTISKGASSLDPIKESVSLPTVSAAVKKLFEVAKEDKEITYDAKTLYVLDLKTIIDTARTEGVSDKILYDTVNLLATLQGLANRNGTHLYVLFVTNRVNFPTYVVDTFYNPELPGSDNPDAFWLKQLSKKGQYLYGKKQVTVKSIGKIVELFKDVTKGAVVWDQRIPATANVASTVAGVEDLVPLRYDTEQGVYDWFVRRHKIFNVKRNLYNLFTGKGTIPETSRQSTGSMKCDAYIWALENYLKTGKTNKTKLAGLLDAFSLNNREIAYYDIENTGVINRDYYVAQRCFFYDLSPWKDQVPNDDRTQKIGTDYQTLCEILRAQNELANGKLVTCYTFAPWPYKYSSESANASGQKYNSVQCEWQTVKLLSSYYIQMDPELLKAFANGSLLQHVPTKKNYTQNDTTPKTTLQNKNYICLYMADWDSSVMFGSSFVTSFWNDPKRGEIPLAWGFCSDFEDRLPHVLNYLYDTKTANDYFVAANNGTGYFNVSSLMESDRPSGLNGTVDSWVNYSKTRMDRFDLDIGAYFIDYADFDKDMAALGTPNETKYFENAKVKQKLMDVYTRIAPIGAGFNLRIESSKAKNVPCIYVPAAYNDKCDAEYTAWVISKSLETPSAKPGFGMYRIMYGTPSIMVEVNKLLQTKYAYLKTEIVDPYTFFSLYKESME